MQGREEWMILGRGRRIHNQKDGETEETRSKDRRLGEGKKVSGQFAHLGSAQFFV